MYPERARRNYRNFFDGFCKVAEEGALTRGSLAHGFKFAGLVAGGGVYDWVKENLYYFFGPITAIRFVGTAAGCAVAMILSMPFDTVCTRLHTMRPLPNGKYPYKGSFHCLNTIFKHEAKFDHYSNSGCVYSGGQAYFLRLFGIAIVSQYLLDYYHSSDKVSEYWQPARFHYAGGIDYDIHNPYTDMHMEQVTYKFRGTEDIPHLHPKGKGGKLTAI